MPKEEKSCGAVVFREEDGKQLYLVLHYSEGHWDLPKGHVEAGETEEETARREILEETGITQLEFMPGFREEIRYRVRTEGKEAGKTVVFFLARTDEWKIRLSSEHLSFDWLPFSQASKRMTYGNARRVLSSAEKALSFSAGAKGRT